MHKSLSELYTAFVTQVEQKVSTIPIEEDSDGNFVSTVRWVLQQHFPEESRGINAEAIDKIADEVWKLRCDKQANELAGVFTVDKKCSFF